VHLPQTRSRSLLLAASLALTATALAPAPVSAGSAPVVVAAPPSLTPASLAAQARIAKLLPLRVAAAPALGRYRTGLVTDLETRAAIWQSGSATPMRGASTTKLATAVTSLRLLGTTTRFPTRVVTGRTPTEVVLVGGGDPMLTSSQLTTLARATAVALLQRLAPPPVTTTPPASSIDGVATPTVTRRPPPLALTISVLLDDTLYPAPTPAAGWTRSYTPYVVRPVRPLVRDFRSGNDVAKDAAAYFATRVSSALAALTAGRADVTAKAVYAGRRARPAASSEIARFAGNTSKSALTRMLLISDNDIAEMLFRDNAIAAGRTGSWTDARVTETLELRTLGVPITGWALYDGSGVSRNDRVSALGLVSLLATAQSPSHPELWPLKSLLPVAGVSGTLHSRFTTAPTRCARSKVFAKTGTLFDTIGLAGYSLGTDNRLRAFAVLVHDVSPRYTTTAVRRAVEVVPATATGCY
jgi:D-alanyl-D-alanine carboxypeptidase/D-alanyl-D-alanine-endopeptidase (penicillin-binding protein 4)